MKEINHQFADDLKAHLDVLDIQRKIKTSETELDKLNQFNGNGFKKFRAVRKIKDNLKNYLQFIESLKQNIETQREEADIIEIPSLDMEDAPQTLKLFLDQGQKNPEVISRKTGKY